MSVFVIFSYFKSNSDDDIVGHKLTREEAERYCDKRDKETKNHYESWQEYNSSVKQYEQKTHKYLKNNLIVIDNVEKEYLQLREVPKPDLSKIPQERHEVVMSKWNEKTGNRLVELEKIMNMSRKDILIHNDNVYKESIKLFGEPSVKPSTDEDETQYNYYYRESEELS